MAGETLSLTLSDGSGQPEPFLTVPSGIGLYRRRTDLALHVIEGQGLSADIIFRGCSFRVGANNDSFLAALIPGGADSSEFEIAIHWDKNGATLVGGALLDLTIPIRAKTPVVELQALHVIITPKMGGAPVVPVELSADLKGALSILSVTISRIGVRAEFYLDDPGKAIPQGPISAQIDFKAPSGGGLDVDLSEVMNITHHKQGICPSATGNNSWVSHILFASN
jgi:hypothetical protein